jgi:hypothetical protein
MINESETGIISHIIFVALFFWQVNSFPAPLTILSKLCKYAGPKPFSLRQPGIFYDFSSLNFILRGLSTAGDALITIPTYFDISSSNFTRLVAYIWQIDVRVVLG